MLYTEEVERERKAEEAGRKMCSKAMKSGETRPTLFGNRRTNALLVTFRASAGSPPPPPVLD
jgi:hypothetical protein